MARLLFVHAHPDDETLASGVTISHYAARGHDCHVLTCTLGDEGEVIPAELVHLDAAHEDRLGVHRAGELAEAVTRLGARHTVLAADASGMPRYRDSGMAGMPSSRDPRAWVNADQGEAAALMAEVLRSFRPDVLVTYDAGGGYGHPDHVQARRIALAAVLLLPPRQWPVAAYELVTPASWAREDRVWLAAQVPPGSDLQVLSVDEPYAVSVIPDHLVSHVVVDAAAGRAQAHALRAHRTQARVFEGYYALSNAVAARLSGREGFARIGLDDGQRLPPNGRGWTRGLDPLEPGVRAPA